MKFARLDIIGLAAILLIPALIALYALPGHEKILKRQLLLGGAQTALEIVQRMKEYEYRIGALPSEWEQIGMSGQERWGEYVKAMVLEPQGVLEVRFGGDPDIEGKRLRFEFYSRDGRTLWRCVSPDIQPDWLPEMCRPLDQL